MFEIEYLESADPLVDIVKSDPRSVFEDIYMGYIFFLFGEADPEASAWIRKHLRSLDSLTGPDIAGVVFAKSFDLQDAWVVRPSSRVPFDPDTHGNKIDASQVQYKAPPTWRVLPIFNRGADARASLESGASRLVATTYASDEIARALGVVSELPCIVAFDPVPRDFRVLHLSDSILPSAVNILRTAIGGFLASDGYSGKRALLEHVRQVQATIASAQSHFARKRSDLAERLKRLEVPLPKALYEARKALIDGSARLFIFHLSDLPLTDVRSAVERARATASMLNRIARTIRGISWYLQFSPWPLEPSDQERLTKILDDHVPQFTKSAGPVIRTANIGAISACLAELQQIQKEMIESIWGELPDLDKLEAERQSAISKAREDCQQHDVASAEVMEKFSVELASALVDAQRGPNLSDSFETALHGYQLKGESLPSNPAALASLLRSLNPHAIQLVARDIYIGTNVGVMGPGASAARVVVAPNAQ